MIVGSSAVNSKRIPIITAILLFLNILVFLKTASVFMEANDNRSGYSSRGETRSGPSVQGQKAVVKFYRLWGFQISDIQKGEYHSIFTNMFVHGGIMHLIGNMLAFWAFAIAMEELCGGIGFVMLYLGCGIVACVTQGLFLMESDIPIIGASGAVAGIMGTFVVLLGFRAHVKVMLWFGTPPVNIPSPIFAALWLFPQLLDLSENGVAEGGGVALISHVAGFAAGAIVGLAMMPSLKSRIKGHSDGTVSIDRRQEDAVKGEQEILDQILATRPFSEVIETLGDCEIQCPECGSNLDLQRGFAGRLVKCTNNACDKTTLIDGELLASHL